MTEPSQQTDPRRTPTSLESQDTGSQGSKNDEQPDDTKPNIKETKKQSLSLKVANAEDRLFGMNQPLGLAPPQRKKLLLALVVVVVVLGIGVGLGVSLSKKNDNRQRSDSEDDTIWCGEGVIGNGICENGACCSYYGYCGVHEQYCVNGQVPAPGWNRTDRFCGGGLPGNGTCEVEGECCDADYKCGRTFYHCGYWPDDPTNTTAPCGRGEVGTGYCEDPSECCSQWGWCGVDEEYCTVPEEVDTIDDGTRYLRHQDFRQNANTTKTVAEIEMSSISSNLD